MAIPLDSAEAAWNSPEASIAAAVPQRASLVQWEAKLHACTTLLSLHEALVQEAMPTQEMLAGAGLDCDAVQSPATRVSLEQILRGLLVVSRMSDDPGLAFRIGKRLRVSHFGMYGFALMSAPNLRTILRVALEQQCMVGQLVRFELVEQGGLIEIVIDPSPHRDLDARAYRFLVEMKFGLLLTCFRDLMGRQFKPASLQVAFAPHRSTQLIATELAADCVYDQPSNVFALDAGWLAVRPKFGNVIAHDSVMKTCRELMGELREQSGLAGRIGEALIQREGHIPTQIEMARTLSLSDRGLRRELQAEGTRYQAICDDFRKQIAMKYLRDTALSVEAIAVAVGFDDTANFRRAFRRWTGDSPMEYRGIAAPFRH